MPDNEDIIEYHLLIRYDAFKKRYKYIFKGELHIMKKYLRAIILSIFLFIVFCVIGFFVNFLHLLSNATGHAYSLILYPVLLFSFGMLLGFQKFRTNMKYDGSWKIDWTRLISIGLPSLLVGLFLFLYYSNIPILADITYIFQPFLSNSFIQMLGQISFGYVLITSVYKNADNEISNV